MASYRKQMEMITKAEMVTDHIAVVLWEEEPFDGIKIIAAKAADELLNVAEVSGAFVLYEEGGVVHISGRCDNTYNVQSVMEQMGGGGHRAAAGAQLKEVPLQAAYETLVGLIRGEEEKGE
jgi:c-di-AMP phosphodiesterase-like protein